MAYLYDQQNRHAPKRANGKRFWGYPTRKYAPQIIAVHTTESFLDLIGVDSGAENVARFQASTDRPSSYHHLVDRDSTIEMLPDEATAFGVVGYNSRALSVALAMQAADWSTPAKAKAAEPALERLADVVAAWCLKYDIPARFITKAQADAGVKGITGHGLLDPGRRSDPGVDFPWVRFIAMVADRLAPITTLQEDDDMKLVRNSEPTNTAENPLYGRCALIGGPRKPFEHVLSGPLAAAYARVLGIVQINSAEFGELERDLNRTA